ncbi:MAG: hypothetical protein M1831_003476 [Alyxoria varia]|nr:MAG: hypothetical protein M1831_003476 [Alyxoria varia]
MASTTTQLSQLKDFLAYIVTLKTDLSNVTAPPFVLAPKSAVEFPASWCSHHSLFLAQGASQDPAERALAVLKNFLCSLKTQTYVGTSEEDGAKKPLNAFLGELFFGQLDESQLISEQAEGYVAQETGFSPSSGVTVKQVGHALIHLSRHDEHHLITLPTLNVKSILSGKPYPELSGTCHITSTNGFTSRIAFEGKKLFRAATKKNSFHAEVFQNDKPDKSIYEVSGQWNGSFTVHDCASKNDIETVDVNTLDLTTLKLASIDQQDPWESRRAWVKVVEGIQKRDINLVSKEKNKIEEAQRAFRREEQEKGQVWPRLFFERKEHDDVASKLASALGESLSTDRTDGVWKFVGLDKADQLKPPYHDGLVPTGHA